MANRLNGTPVHRLTCLAASALAAACFSFLCGAQDAPLAPATPATPATPAAPTAPSVAAGDSAQQPGQASPQVLRPVRFALTCWRRDNFRVAGATELPTYVASQATCRIADLLDDPDAKTTAAIQACATAFDTQADAMAEAYARKLDLLYRRRLAAARELLGDADKPEFDALLDLWNAVTAAEAAIPEAPPQDRKAWAERWARLQAAQDEAVRAWSARTDPALATRVEIALANQVDATGDLDDDAHLAMFFERYRLSWNTLFPDTPATRKQVAALDAAYVRARAALEAQFFADLAKLSAVGRDALIADLPAGADRDGLTRIAAWVKDHGAEYGAAIDAVSGMNVGFRTPDDLDAQKLAKAWDEWRTEFAKNSTRADDLRHDYKAVWPADLAARMENATAGEFALRNGTAAPAPAPFPRSPPPAKQKPLGMGGAPAHAAGGGQAQAAPGGLANGF
ncbi:MAG: hypothetical protein ACREJ2_01500 [Planctomycetota bacterium]